MRAAPLTEGQVYSLRAERDGWDLPYSGKTFAFDGQDWKIDRVTVGNLRGHYPFHVEGRNLNEPPESSDYRFSWSVPRLDDHRFDLSEAIIIRAAK